MLSVREWDRLPPLERKSILMRSEIDIESLRSDVEKIIRTVRDRGDNAVREFARAFDNADLTNIPLAITPAEFDEAERKTPREVKTAIRHAVRNVTEFHKDQVPTGMRFREIEPGVFAGERFTPVPSAGLYVPRGKGSFPSMLYMTAVPARLAGVPEIIITTPPNPDGSVDPACLFAAREIGIERVFRIGGAQAVAAFAYGTVEVPAVAKIVGPGNSYVTAAKRILTGKIDTGLPAGPSESIVFSDGSSDPYTAALDLMIEAEHGSDSCALLVTTSSDFARKTAALVEELAGGIPEPRYSYLRDVFSMYGGILLFKNEKDAIAFINEFAPEHLQIRTVSPFDTLNEIRNAGEILLGTDTPFSAANYMIGANAVLPTGGNARTYGPVSVRDFMKASSVVFCTSRGLDGLKKDTEAMAEYEGFVTHKNALAKREKT